MKWHADDGNSEIEIECGTAEEAAQEYVDGGDWGEIEETCWITVYVWRDGIDEDGDVVKVDRGSHKITLQPEEPECSEGEGHDWQSPYEAVGGIKENPGVWGHGGGVIINECCVRCGCGKQTNTWAQDSEDGEEGLESVSYEPNKYADYVREATA